MKNKEILNKVKQNHSIIVVAVVGIVVAFMAYNYLVLAPQKKLDYQKEKAEQAESIFDSCVESSYKDYAENFEINCTLMGLNLDCNLPAEMADSLKSDYQSSQKLCLEEFKARK